MKTRFTFQIASVLILASHALFGQTNTGVGQNALYSITTGTNDTAVGDLAALYMTSGGNNVAIGPLALGNMTQGSYNTAVGPSTLNVSNASYNTCIGNSMEYTTGSFNAAVGLAALYNDSSGTNNTGLGYEALFVLGSGSNNIGIGYDAGYFTTSGNSSISIGSMGNYEGNTILIGTEGTQTGTYIAGIYGAAPQSVNLVMCVDSTGKLGTTGCTSTPSSRRFKEQITGMGDASSGLFQLRPVTFFYKPEFDDGSHQLQYGMIAEEVAGVFPALVGRDDQGRPNSVKYEQLTPMLLNELQKQDADIRDLQAGVAELKLLMSRDATLTGAQ